MPWTSHLVLLVLSDKQCCHVGRQHIFQQQTVQVLPRLNLVLLRAVLVLELEVLPKAVVVLGGRPAVMLQNAAVVWALMHSVFFCQNCWGYKRKKTKAEKYHTCSDMMSMVTRNSMMSMPLIIWRSLTNPVHGRVSFIILQNKNETFSFRNTFCKIVQNENMNIFSPFSLCFFS